ncbi:hypothetical protein ccbrp13_37230 [Ktedonobacteria bacterium brp13]|nr:hypothetical protein ccbrp13_37230 [Ktedonobacteria bacterium brp13]
MGGGDLDLRFLQVCYIKIFRIITLYATLKDGLSGLQMIDGTCDLGVENDPIDKLKGTGQRGDQDREEQDEAEHFNRWRETFIFVAEPGKAMPASTLRLARGPLGIDPWIGYVRR